MRVLIIEDDEIGGGAIVQRLRLEGFEPVWAKTRAEAMRALKRARPDFIVSDIVLPDGSGEDIYREAQPWLGDTPIVFATAFGEIDQAVRLVKTGADDYLTKPYNADDLVERIGRHAPSHPAPMIQHAGSFALSPATEEIAEQLRRVADTDLPVLITGETGTGKEVAARYLHQVSRRAGLPFVAVNCGAIPRELMESQFFGHERGAFTGAAQTHVGFFEEAEAGTLFLDEIGELDAQLQTALLRVLDDRTFRPMGGRADKAFKGRVVAATNADLRSMRQERRFRDDLYFRLSLIEIALPPLRERKAEIEALAVQFLQEASVRHGRSAMKLSNDALSALLESDWVGNIRELRNRIERAIVLARSGEVNHSDLFPEQRLERSQPATLSVARQQAERDEIEQALAISGGRVAEAAKRLGISRTTLWKKRMRRKD
ncbi:MAG TPA: sigma-54 dependent transcriptional regulator [Pseudolabrys sp.]|nr:sigma-54 dependent transcriptional regulator [Pseudolabrys sp.]